MNVATWLILTLIILGTLTQACNPIINQKLTNKLRKKGHSEEDITEAYKILNPKNNEKNIKKND